MDTSLRLFDLNTGKIRASFNTFGKLPSCSEEEKMSHTNGAIIGAAILYINTGIVLRDQIKFSLIKSSFFFIAPN